MADLDVRLLREAIMDLVERRGIGKTICPSEAARAVAPEGWRALMKDVRAEAIALALDGKVSILRKGAPVNPLDFKGVYRIGLARRGPKDGSRT